MGKGKITNRTDYSKYKRTRFYGESASRGEIKIIQILRRHNIEFEREYIFSDLIGVGGGYLRFDFAIFNNGQLAYLIEFNGAQHYEKNNIWHTKTLVYHDSLKKKYCKKNSIPLIIIPYNKIKRLTINELILKETL